MKRGLGRGLSALIGEKLEVEEINQDGLSKILIEHIVANPNQPRTIFNQAELEELMDSIKQNGILQPILVKPIENGQYEIIAGERRWRASKMLGLREIPAIIKDIEANHAIELALIENVQRQNLTPLEEAETYYKLMVDHLYTQERVAEVVSKSRSHIANLVRLINLPAKVKEFLEKNKISLGHAKLLVKHPQSETLVDYIVEGNLNVRETEELIKSKTQSAVKTKKASTIKTEDLLAIEEHIVESLGLPVEIEISKDTGKISIYFEGMEELDKIVQRLTKSIG